ncbi:MAG: hypothetical protein JNG88_05420 [Phycisphaerales bacterium]|nr:hypothetical protein [Phycisphaerales bacterium]
MKNIACSRNTIGMVLVPLFLSACAPQVSNNTGDAGAVASFVGAIDESRALIALDVTTRAGDRARIFLTDGTPDGHAEFFEGNVTSGALALTSKSGNARISAQVTGESAAGAVTLADGTIHTFAAAPAVAGAGLYEVVIDAAGGWSGRALNGNRLDGELFGKFVLGVITEASGQEVPYEVRDLSRIFNEPALGGAPDTYLIIALAQGDALLGRGGADGLKTGQGGASENFVKADLTGSKQTEGTFFGRFQDLPDLIGAQIAAPGSDGSRQISILVSDGRPAPDGRIEWFSGSFSGDFPDASFALNSLSGAARITHLELKSSAGPSEKTAFEHNKEWAHARLNCPCDLFGCPRNSCGVSGDFELADGTSHKFYLVPAGDGAGLYEAQVSADGLVGVSSSGARLHLQVNEGQVTGTILTPTGNLIGYAAKDLGNTFVDPEKLASLPSTFVLLAVPGGRFIVGSPGNLETGAEPADVAVYFGQLPLQ